MSSSNFPPILPTQYTQWSETNPLRCVAVIDGVSYSVISAKWTENAHGATDTLEVTLPISSNPDFTVLLFRDSSAASTAAELAAANAIVSIELWAGFPQNPSVNVTAVDQLTLFFVGEVDRYSGQFDTDVVTFTCRSVGAAMVDETITTALSTTQTMAQFFAAMVTLYDLPADPIVNLANPPATIGDILAYDQVSGADFTATIFHMHPWDLGIRGAQVDDTDFWLDVRTGAINYQSPSLIKRTNVDLIYGRDWKTAQGSHSPQFSSAIQVQVHSNQPRVRTTTTVRVSDDGFGGVTTSQHTTPVTSQAVLGSSGTTITSTTVAADGTVSHSSSSSTSPGGNFTISAKQGSSELKNQKYDLFVGNVSPQISAQIALAYRRQISQHEYQIVGVVPMTQRLANALNITNLLRIQGLPYGLMNNTFYPRDIAYDLSVKNGWTATITALATTLPQGAVTALSTTLPQGAV